MELSPTRLIEVRLCEYEALERDAKRYRALFDADLIFVGRWLNEKAAASGEGPWVMLLPEQVDAAIDRALDTQSQTEPDAKP